MANGIMTHNCSPEHKCHGIVDLLTLHWDGNSMNVWIDEIKTHPNKDNGSHYLQLMTYATILSDLNCKIIYSFSKKKRYLGNKKKWISWCRKKRREWGQASLGIGIEGDMYYV